MKVPTGVVGKTETHAGEAPDPVRASPACAKAGSLPTSSYTSQATTLDALIAAHRGTPCLPNPSTSQYRSSGTRSDWWGISTVSLGTLVGYFTTQPEGTGSYYTEDARLRLGFNGTGANGGVTYYLCRVSRHNGVIWNCDSIGSGSYSISTLGDARVMSFTNLPALAGKLTYNPILVERGGKVYGGFVVKPVSSDSVRLNLPAANALIKQLIPNSGIVPQ